jgi:nitroreductase
VPAELTALQAIYARRSIRKFQPRPVEQEKLLELLKAAMAAPSAVNSQPWEFVVVSQPEPLARLQQLMDYGRYAATAVIAVCGSPGSALNPSGEVYWVQDCSAALENMLIAATALGLGSVWVGVYPRQHKVEAVSRFLGLPGGVIPLGLVYLGYPAEAKPAGTKYNEKRVHWDNYRSTPESDTGK